MHYGEMLSARGKLVEMEDGTWEVRSVEEELGEQGETGHSSGGA